MSVVEKVKVIGNFFKDHSFKIQWFILINLCRSLPNELDDHLTLPHLKNLKREFRKSLIIKQSRQENSKIIGLSSQIFRLIITNYWTLNFLKDKLNKEEFINVCSSFPFFPIFEKEFQSLFDKIDTKNLGEISLGDLSNYLILKFDENEYMNSLSKVKPLSNNLIVKHLPHNQVYWINH